MHVYPHKVFPQGNLHKIFQGVEPASALKTRRKWRGNEVGSSFPYTRTGACTQVSLFGTNQRESAKLQ